ncbi:MAG TPA: mechanosensitive ion channel domain-containing protein [Acidimicrobiia bacterium]|nr:mechanosensitive ion channel domain-containing protein [Acidimicrobiia bacterium]
MTLENTLVTAGVALGVLVVGWLVLAITRRRLPDRWGEVIRQVTPALGLSVLVVAVLIILDPDRAEVLGDAVMRYVPNALVAVLVVLVARAAGRVIGLFAEAALRQVSASIAQRARIGIAGTILGIGVIIALDQLGVSTDIILLLVAALAFGLALAIGLGFGLGSLPVARQVAAGRHVHERFELGQRLQVGGYVGTLQAIGLASSRIETDDGVLVELPNEAFLSGAVTVLE